VNAETRDVGLDAVRADARRDPDAADRSIAALVVVGDAARRDALSSWLDQAGLRVAATGEPRTAKALFRSAPETYDLVVVDTQLPESDGLELVHRIRETRARVPVVLLSDESPDQVAEQLSGVRGDAETVVLQPHATPQRFTAIVRELLRSALR
jgi:DNA-binding response OmpR family regulator